MSRHAKVRTTKQFVVRSTVARGLIGSFEYLHSYVLVRSIPDDYRPRHYKTDWLT